MKIEITKKERMALGCVKDIIKDHVKLLNEQTDITGSVERILDLGNIYYTIQGIIEKYEEERIKDKKQDSIELPPKWENVDLLKSEIKGIKTPIIDNGIYFSKEQNIVSKEPNQAPTDHILTVTEKEKELHQRAIEEIERRKKAEKHQYKYTFVRSNIGRTED